MSDQSKSAERRVQRTPSYLSSLNLEYIEELEERYREDPRSVDPTWRSFFDGLHLNGVSARETLHGVSWEDLVFEVKVMELVQQYRELGYLLADVDPLDRGIKKHPLLELSYFGLSEEHLDKECHVSEVLGLGRAPLWELIERLKAYYCSPLAVEYAHIEEPESRTWIQKRIESQSLRKELPVETRLRLFRKLCEAEVFETFLHRRFVGQKRFSIEGNDVLIPMLDFLIEKAGDFGTDEILMAMAHRGRLNVLANIFQKDRRLIMAEFTGNLDVDAGEGDVKYHMGFSQNVTTSSGKVVHLSLMPNPSHLEAVNAVLMGVARSKQKLKGDTQRDRTLPLMIHGDASFSGQGVIYETLNMSELKGYTVGGTIHILINNQIGFTTLPQDARSTPYATDVAKMLEIPIFRVNADEPEAALRAILLALEFRNTFKRDVVIDLMGYRRHGHNEADEPSYTQPLIYKQIRSHPTVREIYGQRLVKENVLDEKRASQMAEEISRQWDQALTESRRCQLSPEMSAFGGVWKHLREPTDESLFRRIQTGVSVDRLRKLGRQLLSVPEGFHLHPKLQKVLEKKRVMLEEKGMIDWSLAESLTYATLLCDGFMVRLAGQDSERGTFSQRHAVFYDMETGEGYTPLHHIPEAISDFEIVNSLLSENAALGFEFGQSLANPNKLTIWEAQYGDFLNGAQVIVDQFITCSAVKWNRYSGLVLYLPHGYEGQGPEHSSARLGRLLSLCGQNNIQVCNCTSPAQLFHLLRRQMLRAFRIPLAIMTPKGMLRDPLFVSSLGEFEEGYFQEVIDDPDESLKARAQRVVLCSGKIYFDLIQARKQNRKGDVALVRIEQLYPYPEERLLSILGSYSKAKEFVWCQEGPRNMGPWLFIKERLEGKLAGEVTFVGRRRQASPADGYLNIHLDVQKKLLKEALGVR